MKQETSMNYPNGNTVSEVKNKVTSAASKIGSEIKSEAKDLKSDFTSEAKSFKSDIKSEAKDLKSDIKSGVGKVEQQATEGVDANSSMAGRVLTSALSFLPVKSTDEAFSMLESTLKDVQSGMATARDSATSFVKKYPLYSLLGAAVIGAAAIALVSSRKSAAPVNPAKYDA